MNTYSYALDNPINKSDPSGYGAVSTAAKVISKVLPGVNIAAIAYSIYQTAKELGTIAQNQNLSGTEKFANGVNAVIFTGILGVEAKPTEAVTPLWRAVTKSEQASIKSTEAFKNLPGSEGKYFSTTEEGANNFAEMANKAGFSDGPRVGVVKTSIPTKLITPGMGIPNGAEFGKVPGLTIPTELLHKLTPPSW